MRIFRSIIPFFCILFMCTLVLNSQSIRGVSGMALINSKTTNPEFLVVQDFKVRGDETKLKRFGILKTTKDSKYASWSYSTVDTEDWMNASNIKSNDLEAISKIYSEGNTHRFMAVESSYYKGSYGRIFDLELLIDERKYNIRVLNVFKLPKDVVQIEGIVCLELDQEEKNELLVVISERAGKAQKNTLRWQAIDLDDMNNVEFKFENSIEFSTPFEDGYTRDITDLYLDPSGRLYCSSSRDMGNFGPFGSSIYLIGQIAMETCCQIILYPEAVKMSDLDGFKIEALGAPVLPGTKFTIGTDDERFGSVFRPIGY